MPLHWALHNELERGFDMKKEGFRSNLLALVIIPIGGLVALGFCYLLYLLTYNLVESLFFSTNPTSLPASTIRRIFALALLVLYLVLFRAKISDIVKGAVLVGPMGILLSTAILTFYQQPAWAIALTVLIAAGSMFLLYKSKRPWFYYYAVAIAVLASVALAWPRA